MRRCFDGVLKDKPESHRLLPLEPEEGMTSAVTLAPRWEAIPPVQSRSTDFEVSRIQGALWSIRPVSERARRAAPYLLFQGGMPQGDAVVYDHQKSNALLYRLRQDGFRILYHGPAGPIDI